MSQPKLAGQVLLTPGTRRLIKVVDDSLTDEAVVDFHRATARLRSRQVRLLGQGFLHVGTELIIGRIEGGITTRTQEGAVYVSVQPVQGIQHHTVLLEEVDQAALQAVARDLHRRVSELLAEMDADMGSPGDAEHEVDVFKNSRFSGVVFVLCHKLQGISLGDVVQTLKLHGYSAKVYDDERWERRMAQQQPDILLSHDSRDKEAIARPLYEALTALGLKVWFDEATLNVGDDLAASLDAGLRDCRRAALIVTPHLLANRGWASTELNTLLNRRAKNASAPLILPVWAGVSEEDVAARSAMLANIVAEHWDKGAQTVAARLSSALDGSGL